jgi:hypothetical protein
MPMRNQSSFYKCQFLMLEKLHLRFLSIELLDCFARIDVLVHQGNVLRNVSAVRLSAATPRYTWRDCPLFFYPTRLLTAELQSQTTLQAPPLILLYYRDESELETGTHDVGVCLLRHPPPSEGFCAHRLKTSGSGVRHHNQTLSIGFLCPLAGVL